MKTVLRVFLALFTLFCCIDVQAQVIVPTQTDEIIIDNGTPGKANPNDRIRYKVTIQNTGGATGNDVKLNAVPDPRTTFVPGSFRSSPLAVNDNYTVTGNLGITVPAASGVKANDFDDNLAAASVAITTTPVNGTITLNGDGSFTYTPNPGFTGTESFTYTLTDGNPVGLPVPLTDVATVTLTVSNMIWFVDNTGGGTGGAGILANPFKTLGDFNSSSGPQAGHTVFVKNTGTNYTGGIVLKNNQVLFGTGHTGGANLADVLGFTLAPFSPALPVINGTRPVITNTGGNGIALASGNTIRGVEVGNTSGAKISGSAFGTLTVGNTTAPDVLLGGTGQALNLTNGTFAATSKFVSVTSTGSTTSGIALATVAGTVALGSTSISGNTTQGILVGTSTANIDFGNTTVSAGTDGISLQNNSAGTRTFGTIGISGNSGVGFLHAVGGGAVTAGNTTITNPGGTSGIDIKNSTTAVTFGNTTVTKTSAGNGVTLGGAGSGNTGAVTFANLNVTVSNGIGLLGTGNSGQITVTNNTGSISSTGGAAISINHPTATTPVTLNFTNVSASGGANGVNLCNTTGTFSASGGSITGSTSSAFLVSGATVEVTYGGAITGNSALAVEIFNHSTNNITFQTGNITSTTQGIRVQSCNGGIIAFNNPTKNLSTGTNTAVSLTINSNTTINFSSPLNITTTSGTGFNATGGGTTSVAGATNTIASTTGIALNVDNVTIGAGNLNFLSIAANGASSGIVLNNTGSSGGLLVTGSGTTSGSGGTIQNVSNRGVSATNSINLSLKNMTFTNANMVDAGTCDAMNNSGCNAAIHVNGSSNLVMDNVNINGAAQQGINLREVNGFQLLNSTVINGGAGGDVEEADFYGQNLSGTCAITSSSLTVPAERALVIYNVNKTMALTVTGSTFGMNQTQPLGADGLELNSLGTSNTTLNIVNSTFVQPKTNGVQIITDGTSTASVNVTGSTFDPGTGLSAAIDLVANSTSTLNFNVINNPSIKAKGINVVNVFAFAGAKFHGRINNNTIINNGGSGAGVRVISQGNENNRVEIKNNSITAGDDQGILVNALQGSGQLEATVTGNTVSVTSNGFYGIQVAAGVSSSAFTNKVCANVANNTATFASGAIGNFQGRAATPSHQLLLQGGGTTVQTNWDMNGNMPLSTAPGANVSQSGTGVFTFGATCLLPTHPMP